MFGEKFPQLKSMIGKESITAEELASLNLELQEKGVEAVSFIDRSQEAASDVQALRDQLAQTNTQLTAAQDALTAMTAERDNLKKELEDAGAKRTTVGKDKDRSDSGKVEWNDPNADYNQNAKRAIGIQ